MLEEIGDPARVRGGLMHLRGVARSADWTSVPGLVVGSWSVRVIGTRLDEDDPGHLPTIEGVLDLVVAQLDRLGRGVWVLTDAAHVVAIAWAGMGDGPLLSLLDLYAVVLETEAESESDAELRELLDEPVVIVREVPGGDYDA